MKIYIYFITMLVLSFGVGKYVPLDQTILQYFHFPMMGHASIGKLCNFIN
jgi:riboflavin transporter FmnP